MLFDNVKKIKSRNVFLDGVRYVELSTLIPTENNENKINKVFEMYYSDTSLTLDIKPHQAKRSISANNYAWRLICDIAGELITTKEEVYRTMVHDYGTCDIKEVNIDSFEDIVTDWCGRGLGYFCDIGSTDSVSNTVSVFFYKGTSTYTNREMSLFLQGVVFEALQLGIEVRTPSEIEKIKAAWQPNIPFPKEKIEELEGVCKQNGHL